LEERNRYAGDASDLECAARHGGDALALCHSQNIVCPTVWVLYADVLESDFEITSNSEELRMAEELCREALPLCVAFHPLSSTIHHTLSWILKRRSEQNGDQALINEAAHLQRIALERLPETEFNNRHRHLRRLADILSQADVYGWYQNPNEALSTISEAFRICPLLHIDRWMVHSKMMGQLCVEYARSGEQEILNKAIELGRQALSKSIFPDPVRRAISLFRTADALQARHAMGQANDDLEESVKLFREALLISEPSHANYSYFIQNLALALVSQFCSSGDMSHLEEASQLYHQAIDVLPIAHPRRYIGFTGLAQCLSLHFMDTGDIAKLNRAIELDEEALAALDPSSVYHVNSALQMVSHLCLRFETLHKNDDLNKAIAVAEELLRFLHDGDPNRLEVTHAIAKVRLLGAVDKDNLVGLDLAIDQLLSVKDGLSRSYLGPESLRNLAACYMIKFRHSSAVDNALLAREIVEETLERVNTDHYERFQCLIDAAKLYMEHGTPYYNIDIALRYLSDALGNSHRDARSKIRGAKQVLIKLEKEHHYIFITTSSTSLKLLDIIVSAVLLLPRIAFFGIHPRSRLQSLKEGQRIAMTGASHALNLSLPEKALEIMEQGRAIFWTHTLRLRSPFDDIPEELQSRLLALARRLDKVVDASERSTDQRYVEIEIARRRKDSEEFNSLIDQARRLPGQERFMLPDEYSSLRKVAEKGPVVILVSSTLANHAIVLKSSKNAVSITLEAITEKWLVESASVWRSAMIETRSKMRDGRKLVKSKKSPGASYMAAERILRLLWINVVWPVIQVLGIEARLYILLF
jgi:tetratricopeptide (TPR) repeat protein